MKKRILSLSLALALVIGMVTQTVAPLKVDAATVGSDRVSDANTTGTYNDALGVEGNSTRYSGRVWTDKTVFTGNANFTGTVDSEEKTYTIQNDSDFLVAFSALANSTAIRKTETVPVDVVFVLDLSGSMNWAVDAEEVTASTDVEAQAESRLQAMVNSLNSAIDQLVTANENTRIGIVTFNDKATNVYTLDQVTKRAGQDYLNITSFQIYISSSNKREANATIEFRLNESTTSTADTAGGTNIQAGLYLGMKQLADVSQTTATVGGKEYTRQPYVILMSDGAPTTFASAEDAKWEDESGKNQTGHIVKGTKIAKNSTVTSGSWWNNLYTDAGIGSGNTSNPDSGDGFMAILTAAYYKNVITEKYYPTGGDDAAKVYTIGFSTEYQTEDMQKMVDLVLNPAAHYATAKESKTTEIQRTADAMDTYVKKGTTTVYGSIGNRGGMTYNVQHPTGNASQYDPAGDVSALYYPDQYYSANDAEGLEQIFDDIVSHITTTTPEVPTEVGDDPLNGGYITYTDPIGEYMKVDKVKAILWGNTLYRDPTNNGDGSYTFYETVYSPAYGEQNLSSISIKVTENGRKQTLTVEIPAALIPLRVNTLTMKDGTVEANESNGIYPMRLFYTVGMKDGVIDENGKVNPQAVTQEYLDKNTNPDGTVNFYSNLYSGHKQNMAGVERTVGDANVTFEPSNTNPYYFNQEQVPLYTDPDCTTPAKGPVDLSDTYYRNVTYYEDKAQPTAHVKITTSEYQTTDFETNADGQLCLKAGTYRISTLTSFIKDKEGSTTNTAQASYYPTYDKDAAGVQNGQFTVYLGNNGVLSAPMATGSLTLSKQVEGAGADRAKSFTFTVTLKDANDASLTGSYPYVGGVLQNVEGNPSAPDNGNLVLNEQGSGTVTLTHGQTITVRGLPVDATFTVSEAEANQDGYTTTVSVNGVASETATGTVGQSSTVAFTNTRAVGSLTVTKTVTGDMGDKSHPFAFSVTLTDANGDPMTGSVTYTKSGKEGESEQGALTLTDAGVGTFELTDGQSIAFNSLPVGTQYSVTETEADQNGYTTSVQAVPSANVSETDVVSGTIVADGATTVTYTNYRGLTPPTDVSDPGSVYQVMLGVGGICALTIVGCSFLVWRRRRRDWM